MNSLIISQIRQFSDPSLPAVSRLCNAIAALHNSEPAISWTGIYFSDANSQDLILGPFQGKPACMKIRKGTGIIGRCVRSERPVVIDNVLEQPDHIACDSASRSEIVIPIWKTGKLCAVLDIDSNRFSTFANWESNHIEALSHIFSDLLEDMAE